MQDKSIDNALLALRKQIIRGNLDGLEHVEALLRSRGVDMPRVMPAKRSDVARRGYMRLWIMEALRDGQKTLQQLTDRVAVKTPDVERDRVYKRVSVVLAKMKAVGMESVQSSVYE